MQETFTKQEFRNATGWSRITFNTYFRKHFDSLLTRAEDDEFRVNTTFIKFCNWRKFRTLVSQKRVVATNYVTFSYDNVVGFEFFLPLTHESYLKEILDALFYKNTIISRLRTVDSHNMDKLFPLREGESADARIEKVCEWISTKFVGYSISHVDGRYRAGKLQTLQEVFNDTLGYKPAYLIDETTAVVRFIFPCGTETYHQFGHAKKLKDVFFASPDHEKAEADAVRIRWLFYELFTSGK